MKLTSDGLKASGIFNDIDIHLADFLTGKAADNDPALYLLILLLSNRLAQGDVCLDISQIADRPLSDFTEAGELPEIKIPDKKKILSVLKKSGIAGNEGELFPLILDEHNRIYFQKYNFFEKELADSVKSMAKPVPPRKLTPGITEMFLKLFPCKEGETDWQGVAALCALNSSFSVISGGPGTGKTSTVIRILALLVEMMGRDISIALAAPTGKAAARLRESVTVSLETLPVSDDIKKAIPGETYTIHRLLGSVSGSPEFRHNRENPLRYDVIVVDECSMADLALMYRFFEAVKPEARVILLGDRDQLSSVEGGAVFGDICDRGRLHGYPAEFITRGSGILGESFSRDAGVENKDAPLSGAMTILRKSFRFSGDSGIGLLADMIRSGDSAGAVKLFNHGGKSDIVLAGECTALFIEETFRKAAADAFSSGGRPRHESIYEFIKGFAILTATRRGPGGAAALNLMAERVLEEEGVIIPAAEFYEGRPVMVTRNDYTLALFNGDIGVTCFKDGELRVMFEKPDGEKVYIHPSRMPEHETAFAMTIHKSQGSEFSEVIVVLPPVEKRLLTRELLYTAVTRGKKKVVIASDKETVAAMIENPLQRMTGLKERLWGIT
ncbi:MAG TPA: exodeoxyribonuclease V subunit alpha [Spirochaetota bacterium]|nr:exodeoxyribonuclease V subunit alpha [Spirochaetota bacterium]